jgi:uncharacterized membrane protein YdbT with pleckstrin-like domain
MTDEIGFRCNTSQWKNTFSFTMSILLTVALLWADPYMIVVSDAVLSGLSGFTDIPALPSSILLYVFLALVWLMMGWKVLKVKALYYEFEDERVLIHHGVLNKEMDPLEYFRIKDPSVKRPLLCRLARLHNLHLVTTDRSHPFVIMAYITNFDNREPELRQGVDKATRTGRGREVDVV